MDFGLGGTCRWCGVLGVKITTKPEVERGNKENREKLDACWKHLSRLGFLELCRVKICNQVILRNSMCAPQQTKYPPPFLLLHSTTTKLYELRTTVYRTPVRSAIKVETFITLTVCYCAFFSSSSASFPSFCSLTGGSVDNVPLTNTISGGTAPKAEAS